jgi:hypothetical protein
LISIRIWTPSFYIVSSTRSAIRSTAPAETGTPCTGPNAWRRGSTCPGFRTTERRRYLLEGLGSAFDERLVAETDGFSMAQVKEVRVAACLDAIQRGRAEPTPAAAFKVIERMRGTKAVARKDWEPQRTIAGFQWSRTCDRRKPTS